MTETKSQTLRRPLLPALGTVLCAFAAAVFCSGPNMRFAGSLTLLLCGTLLVSAEVFLRGAPKIFLLLPVAASALVSALGRLFRPDLLLLESAVFLPLICVLWLGLSALFFGGIGLMGSGWKKRIAGGLLALLSLLAAGYVLLSMWGPPVERIRAKKALHSWVEENLDGERYEPVGFAYDWFERKAFLLQIRDRENGRIKTLSYRLYPTADGDPIDPGRVLGGETAQKDAGRGE